ncbi:transposable element Tcb2 transposase [Trichonephila clavipes]|nr:transposable element Tcb2 transposase [Trichonephila clavipes]
MVWGAIAYNTWSLLIFIYGSMLAQRYVYDILQPLVFPLLQRLSEVIFQQDNARPHTARGLQDCLRTVTTLPWPSRTPDLSPIEHIWDHLEWRVRHPPEFERTRCKVTTNMAPNVSRHHIKLVCIKV